jgi:GxxExxY protein
LDLVIDNQVVVEIKTVETLLPVHQAQLLTYLKLSRKRIGLLLNFNEPVLKRGLKRLVNSSSASSASEMKTPRLGVSAVK